MPSIPIDSEDIVFEKRVQRLCSNPHYRCPNYDRSWGCPPAAPYMEEGVSRYEHHLLIYVETALEGQDYQKANIRLKQEFEREMLATAKVLKEQSTEIMLLWSGHCNLCYTRMEKICSYRSNQPCRFPEEIRYSMEAVGINVDATVKHVGIDLEWPPKHKIFRFGLISYMSPSS